MNSKRMFYVMAAVTSLVAILVIGSLVLGSKLLGKQSDKLVALKLENRVLDEQDQAIVQANKDIEKYKDLLAVSKAIVPQDKDQAKTIREIVIIAQANGVNLQSFTFNTSSLGQIVPKAVVTPGSEGTTTPVAPTVSVPSQAEPVLGLAGVYSVPIIMESGQRCSYSQLISFLAQLEQKRRTAQVTEITLKPDPNNPNFLDFSLKLNIFVKP